MLKALVGLAIAAFVSSPASAALYRVDVTGSAEGFWRVSQTYDISDDFNWVDLGGGEPLNLRDVPDDVLGPRGPILRSVLNSNTGSLLYSASGGFSECRGLLAIVCTYDVWMPLPPIGPEFDALLNTFSVQFFEGTGFSMLTVDAKGFGYDEDLSSGGVIIGNLLYLNNGVGLFMDGVFDEMRVSVVPLPAAVPLLLTALGSLLFLRRRKI